MNGFFEKAGQIFNNFSFTDVIDIILISLIIYILFKFLLKNNSVLLIKILLAAAVAAVLINIIDLSISSRIARYLLLFALLAVVVIYATEIKRLIWLSKKKFEYEKITQQTCTEDDLRESAEHIVRAVQNMAKKDIGALIVFVINQPPSGVLESGVALNGLVSSQLIESIFIPKSPLHDGAVLIKDNKILAAGCFLPLSLEVNLPKEFGTRHRAAIGITEQHDVMAVVVSEETGIISIARNGVLKRYIDGEMLKEAIESAYGLTAEKEDFWKKEA